MGENLKVQYLCLFLSFCKIWTRNDWFLYDLLTCERKLKKSAPPGHQIVDSDLRSAENFYLATWDGDEKNSTIQFNSVIDGKPKKILNVECFTFSRDWNRLYACKKMEFAPGIYSIQGIQA